MDRLNDTTFKREVKTNPKDRIEFEVGDSKQPDFKPQVKMMRWDNEVNFSIRAEEVADAVVEEESGVVKYKTPKYEVHQYEKPEAGEDGGFEFEWVLKEKPDTNVLTTTIQSKGLDFFYQPELTKKEMEEGAHRPDNVIGSYAVYHSTKGGMNRADGMEYKTGKFCHIYRPEAVDANGDKTWCDLNIENGLLTVTVPQKFLNKAVYPVVVDPTFGYTSLGVSNQLKGANSMVSMLASNYTEWDAPENGTINSVSVGFTTGSINTRPIVYDDDNSNALVTYGSQVSTSANQFNTLTVTDAPITSGVAYIMGPWLASNANLRYDTASGYTFSSDSFTYHATDAPDSTWTASASTFNQKASIYATYTASGGGGDSWSIAYI